MLLELSILSYYRDCEDVVGFPMQNSHISGVLVLIDHTIAYFVTALQFEELERKHAGVKVRAANDS